MQTKTVLRRYPGEWVAMRVTRVDRADVPVEGEVIAHATGRRALHAMARRFRADHSNARVFIFFAGDPIPEGLAVSLDVTENQCAQATFNRTSKTQHFLLHGC